MEDDWSLFVSFFHSLTGPPFIPALPLRNKVDFRGCLHRDERRFAGGKAIERYGFLTLWLKVGAGVSRSLLSMPCRTPSGSGQDPQDQRHLSQRVEGHSGLRKG